MDPSLQKLADLIQKRNRTAGEITELIGRPAQIGHVGEYLASRLFDIQLEDSAVAKGIDGHFRSGELAGRHVNVKFYGKREGILDLRLDAIPDFYLVMTGPKSSIGHSRGEARPWCVDYVFLFEGRKLLDHLVERGVKICEATSVISAQWDRAEIYPNGQNQILTLDKAQLEVLKLFRSSNITDCEAEDNS